ncbi:MAG: hypothetical protein HFH23_14575 [Ruminococcus sp.]|nr:hypothetical protein [Ruminococcus sp.]
MKTVGENTTGLRGFFSLGEVGFEERGLVGQTKPKSCFYKYDGVNKIVLKQNGYLANSSFLDEIIDL